MRKLLLWDDIHDEVAKLQQLFDPKLSKAVEAVALTIHCDPGLTKKEIREQAGVRKQRVSQVLKKLLEVGWLKTVGRGVRRARTRRGRAATAGHPLSAGP